MSSRASGRADRTSDRTRRPFDRNRVSRARPISPEAPVIATNGAVADGGSVDMAR
jgi:hypothetical protein